MCLTDKIKKHDRNWTRNEAIVNPNILYVFTDVSEFNNGNYEFIMFPNGDSLFNRKISNITIERTPKLYKVLEELLCEFGFDVLIHNK